jgi:hypothetical protein
MVETVHVNAGPACTRKQLCAQALAIVQRRRFGNLAAQQSDRSLEVPGVRRERPSDESLLRVSHRVCPIRTRLNLGDHRHQTVLLERLKSVTK